MSTRLLLALVITASLAGDAVTSAAPAAAPAAAPPLALAPGFTLPTLTGTNVSLAQYRGRVVLVNFWATWCPPCRAEMPILMKLQQTFAPAGFEVLGVAVDDEGARVVAPWVRTMRFPLNGTAQAITFPILIGSPAVADTYGEIDSFPASFLIAADGRIVKRFDGMVDEAELTGLLRSMLAR